MRAVQVKRLVYTLYAGKNDANTEEIIADGGFGFHAKVKVSFLKPEKVNMLIFLSKKMQARSPTASLVLLLILFSF